jgi:hypothetical protein
MRLMGGIMKKRLVLFAATVNILLIAADLIEEAKKDFEMKKYALDPLKIWECVEEEVINFKPEILIFLYPKEQEENRDILYEKIKKLIVFEDVYFLDAKVNLKIALDRIKDGLIK